MLHRLQPYAKELKQAICLYQYTPDSPAQVEPAASSLLFEAILRKLCETGTYHVLSKSELAYIDRAILWFTDRYPDHAEALAPLHSALNQFSG